MTTPEGIDAHADHDDGDGDNSLMVTVGIIDANGTNLHANGHAEEPVSDEPLADLIIKAAIGCAAMYGPGVWMALQRRLTWMDSQQ